jgi:hypothetical protein
MILNLLRANDLNVEDMIKRSFSEFGMQRIINSSEVSTRISKYEYYVDILESKAASIISAASGDELQQIAAAEECARLTARCSGAMAEMLNGVGASGFSPLSPGRVIVLERNDGDDRFGPCIGAVLSGPRLPEAAANSGGDKANGGSVGDIRRALIAPSAAAAGASSAAATGEGKSDSDLLSCYVWVLVLVPPIAFSHTESQESKEVADQSSESRSVPNSTATPTESMGGKVLKQLSRKDECDNEMFAGKSGGKNKASVQSKMTYSDISEKRDSFVATNGKTKEYLIKKVSVAQIAVVTDHILIDGYVVASETASNVHFSMTDHELRIAASGLCSFCSSGDLASAYDICRSMKRSDVDVALSQNIYSSSAAELLSRKCIFTSV